MNNTFVNEDFLLSNAQAKELYHTYAAHQPIIDYHNHLPPQEIATDKMYANITQLWIGGDHYKWRAMRTLGIKEDLITGSASDREKFLAWAKAVPQTLRNPLYHWTHLELKRYFGIDELLNEKNAASIYDRINEQLKDPVFSCRGLLNKMKFTHLCTTDDPIDDLKYHQEIKNSGFEIGVFPAFRPDKVLFIEQDGFINYVSALAKSANMEIDSLQDLKDALLKRLDFFHANGCRISDHGLSHLSFSTFRENGIADIFKDRKSGKIPSPQDSEKFKTAILLFLGEEYHKRGWVQQFHLGALRNTNSRKLSELGPDTGWDSIGDYNQAEKLAGFLDALDRKDKLSKTILYNLNPAQNDVFASMVGNFNDGSVRGKVQYGSGWWYNDQKDGMIKQLNALSNIGLLSCFVGMLTDSRSFLSFPRHEYFRRVLCDLLGREIASGELPQDMDLIGKLVSDVCYGNAKRYFDF